ncbi:LCP family protein [Pedobacter gandavensis]|uniref:LytR family transcriptional regulator n=1 Tax=Pedobacter gandavensis TaxID=2679963 RepID=A0ABR6EY90_9SPHI|nr:LCP family protein [Pedobacter gandavensis]MBB2149926.1 LytR family transcriptional regulator [Pedobacter gandavensis]
MKTIALTIFLLSIGLFQLKAQDSTRNNLDFTVPPAAKKVAQLNRSDAALGISAKARARQKNTANPAVNLALFAVDRRTEAEAGNSDVVMVISIDQLSGKIKMSSIMRDTYVNIEGNGMNKLNAAFAIGGPQLAIKTINQNFDLDIRDYINVDFYGAAKIVDALGGVPIPVKAEELPYLNTYLNELSIYDKIPAIPLSQSGLQKLSGKQAVAYSRIRAVGHGDAQRTERQRLVLIAIFDKMKVLGKEIFPVFATEVLPNLETSMNNLTLFSFAGSILNSKNKTIEQARFPLDKESVGKRIDNIWYLTTDLKTTTNSLHQFIYGNKH